MHLPLPQYPQRHIRARENSIRSPRSKRYLRESNCCREQRAWGQQWAHRCSSCPLCQVEAEPVILRTRESLGKASLGVSPAMMVMEVDSHLGGLVFPVQDLVEGPGVKLAEDSEPGRVGPHQWEVG